MHAWEEAYKRHTEEYGKQKKDPQFQVSPDYIRSLVTGRCLCNYCRTYKFRMTQIEGKEGK